jgi:heterogeneous nuclear ribonucleoprotein A1/A3
VTDAEVAEKFSTVGTVIQARVIMDRTTGKSRGFAFVEFADASQSAEAIRLLNDQPLRGRNMRVNDADDRPPKRTSGPVPPTFSFSGFSDAGGRGGEGERPFRSKGSRRGLRKRKRSL